MGNLCKNKVSDINSLNYNRRFNSEKCLICWEHMGAYLFYPCGHFGVCKKCVDILNRSVSNTRPLTCTICNHIKCTLVLVYFCKKHTDYVPSRILTKQKSEIRNLSKQLKTEKQINNTIKKKAKFITNN
jgi:hypothetical protein